MSDNNANNHDFEHTRTAQLEPGSSALIEAATVGGTVLSIGGFSLGSFAWVAEKTISFSHDVVSSANLFRTGVGAAVIAAVAIYVNSRNRE